MTKMKALLLTASVCGSLIAVPASATEVWDGTAATDTVSVTQFGADYATVASGTTFTSTGGVSGTFTTGGGGLAYRLTQGSSWGGNFAPNEPLLYNGAAFGSNAGDLIFNFNTPVFGVGAQFMADFYGSFVARIILSDGSFFDFNGTASGTNDGSAIFVGGKNSLADITSIAFHQESGAGGNDFAISSLSLLTVGVDPHGAVPEPGTWLLLLLGFGAIGFGMRNRNAHQNVAMSYA